MQISHVWLHFFNLPPYAEIKPSENCNFFAFADGGNRTQATFAISERAIHYTIASWQLNEILAMVLFTTTSNGHSDFFVLFLFFVMRCHKRFFDMINHSWTSIMEATWVFWPAAIFVSNFWMEENCGSSSSSLIKAGQLRRPSLKSDE